MGKTCGVVGCNTGTKKEKRERPADVQISVFRFPQDEVEKQRWISAIPRSNLEIKPDTVVCSLHWPAGYATVMKNGKVRPRDPPSIWPDTIPDSCIPSPAPSLRPTQRTSSSTRNVIPDEYELYKQEDEADFSKMKTELINGNRTLASPVIVYMDDETLCVQSKKMCNGIPLFIVRISKDQKFENYHLGVKVTTPSLSKNKITVLKCWSAFDANLKYLSSVEVTNKQTVINQHISAMCSKTVGQKMYCPDIIIRAFQYFVLSRSLYHRLRIDYQLPSVQTLTKITSKVAKLDETAFGRAVFNSLDEKLRNCIVLQDEVYVKKMMLYHGGQVFGKSADDPDSLAKTVLGIMVNCMFGGPKFISKLIPVSKLNATFLYEQMRLSIDCIEQAGGHVKAVICDGNRNNQAYFKKCAVSDATPYITEAGMYLLFDYVHLLKNIRNNWLTEKCGELTFMHGGVQCTAKWRHLVTLYKLEAKKNVKLSDLTEVAVTPKPIERQKVSLCLKVFSEKTSKALLEHKGMENFEGVSDTVLFIDKVLEWWKIVNVRSPFLDSRFNDELRGAISDPDDPRLQTLLDFGDMALAMRGDQGSRIKKLTLDTAKAIHHTCYGLVNLCKELLSTTHEYVLLGQFSSDPLEKQFGKLRQGSGGTYFINVQQIVEKCNIDRARLLLLLKADEDYEAMSEGHSCGACQFEIESHERACETVDNIAQLEASVSEETIKALVYIAGYVTRDDPELDDDSSLCVTTYYYERFGGYFKELDKGGLNIPTDTACQWTIFTYILFSVVKDSVCRTSLCKLALALSDTFKFHMELRHARILSNVLLNNHCLASTPRSSKEPALKRIKMSDSDTL